MQTNKLITGIFLTVIVSLLISCSPKMITEKYYLENEAVLDKIEETYKELYPKKHFSLAFTDRWFQTVSVEIITDTLSYIYEFNFNESRLKDTLLAYQLDTARITGLIAQMRSIRCTWINNFDYYDDEKKNSLILMSIKPVALKALFAYSKYYILTYFSQPQHFDSEGKLLDKRGLRRYRKINGEVFKRINDKVCYAIAGKFR